MKKYLEKIITSFLCLILLVGSIVVTPVAQAAICNSSSECAQMLQENQKAASGQKVQVDNAQNAINSLGAQISTVQAGINIRIQQINLTTSQIDRTQAEITQKTKDLAVQKANLNETIVTYYENSNQSTLETVVSSNSLSDAIDREQYSTAIGENLNNAITKINQTMADLKVQSENLDKAKNDLLNQKDSLITQQKNLQLQQQTQDGLLKNAQGTLNSLKSQQSAISVRLQQFAVIRGTSAWGTQIVSNSRASWYLTQLGDYTPLGDSSDYNVNNAGCYITSLAMVANFYGHNINVSNIASHANYFSDGNLQGWVPSVAYGLNVSGGQSWSTVNQQIDAGKPVIARLQLGGGTHFIVLNGRSGDKYLMQDPLGTNRGYNISQISDLRIVSPN